MTPCPGSKISSYLKGTHTCHSDDWEEVALCMSALRSFHGRKLRVEHSFDLWERIDFYESLWNGEKSLYVDYRQTKETVLSLRRFIDAQPKTLQLCHIDSIPDNFLFSESPCGRKTIKAYRLGYSGTQDPTLILQCSSSTPCMTARRLTGLSICISPRAAMKPSGSKIYCYIAVSGLPLEQLVRIQALLRDRLWRICPAAV